MPDKICTQCTLMVSRAFRFKQLCEKSNATLQEYINSTRLTNEISEIKSELLLVDNSLVNDHCSVYTDIFLKTNSALEDPLMVDHSALTAGIVYCMIYVVMIITILLLIDVSVLEATMQTMTEHCLPSLWNMKRNTDYITESPDNLNNYCPLQDLAISKQGILI